MSSTTSSSNKRNSIVPPLSQAGPRPAVKIAPSVTIDGAAHLTGSHPIGIGAESVIHPRAKLNSLGGRITVGRRCIVEERATLGAPSAEARQGVTLGDYVVVHVDAVVEAGGTVVQDGAVIGVGARVGKGAVIGKVSISEAGQRPCELMRMPSSIAHLHPWRLSRRGRPSLIIQLFTEMGCGGRIGA